MARYPKMIIKAIKMLADGKSTKEIMDEVGCSKSTVTVARNQMKDIVDEVDCSENAVVIARRRNPERLKAQRIKNRCRREQQPVSRKTCVVCGVGVAVNKYHGKCVDCYKRDSHDPPHDETCTECGAPLGSQNRTGKCKRCNYTVRNALRNTQVLNYDVKRGVIPDTMSEMTTSEIARIKLSCAHQGITVNEWDGFAVESKYCPKFDEACRERNREKYDRRCFLCNKTESENGRKLSVHHVDMNKQQGCDNHVWQLVPLCAHHHGTSHNDLWRSRIEYLLTHVWG